MVETEIPYRRAEEEMGLGVGRGVWLDPLHAPVLLITNTVPGVDDNSLIMRLHYGQLSALLSADVMEEPEKVILGSGRTLDSPVPRCPLVAATLL
jgi:hypothetical protein